VNQGGAAVQPPTAGRYPGVPGVPGVPSLPVNSQTGGVSPYSTVPGSQGNSPNFPQPGAQTGGNNQAVNLINQILTTPRPGGIPTAAGSLQGQQIGAGIAGVASTSEDEGIIVYNERTKYNEWEFIYDPTKDRPVANPNAGGVGVSPDKLGSSSAQSNTNPQPAQQQSPFGGNSGFGNSGIGGNSGFGGSGFGGGSQPQTGFGRP